ncbi:MAG: PD40 domain-containing protein [Candidatus Eremiobacteraeota bacterium]|nr:PD40 domain-containing protein [Candidatus Eremiobacteraeota bacterium]
MKEVFLPIVFATILLAVVGATDSLDTRQITNPQTVVSLSEPGAGPVPIADLFETRGTAGGGWSPDGKQIVFSANTSGRYNIWAVGTDGGAPRQLSKSNDPIRCSLVAGRKLDRFRFGPRRSRNL